MGGSALPAGRRRRDHGHGIACGQPGCPPLETVIALLREGQKPTTFKLYKALNEVSESDVLRLGKPGWTMRDEGRGW